MLRPRMFILSTGETKEPSKEIGKLEGILEREIYRSWVFKELNFTRLRRSHPQILSSSENRIGKIKTRGNSRSKRWSRIETVSYTHLRAHETPEHLVCRLLLEK